MRKCKGSGGMQMIDWNPDPKPTDEFPNGYPGAVVCIGCSFGVLIIKGSDHDAVSQAGHKGRAGKVRVHYISGSGRHPEKMSYKKR